MAELHRTVVTAAGGPSKPTGHAAYNYLPAPRVTALSPATGPRSGGTTVTISGTSLAFIKAVYFGAHRASHLVVLSGRRIRVVDPAGSGTLSVRVVTLGGASTAVPGARFRYTAHTRTSRCAARPGAGPSSGRRWAYSTSNGTTMG